MKKTTKDGSQKKQTHHAIDDLPPLYEMKSNEAIQEERPPEPEVWIGSLANAVRLPEEPQEGRSREFRMSKQVEVDVKYQKMPEEHKSRVSAKDLARSKHSERSANSKQLIESIVTEDADRIRYPAHPPPPSTLEQLYTHIVLSPHPTPPLLFSPDVHPRELLATILTNPTKFWRFIESLVDLMTDPHTTPSQVGNLELLVLLLKKLTQDNIEIKQTRYDIEISFNEEELRKKNREIAMLKRKLVEKDQEERALAEEFEAIIQEMKENIQVVTARRKQQMAENSTSQPNPLQEAHSTERYADRRSNSMVYHEEQEVRNERGERGERGWTFSIKK